MLSLVACRDEVPQRIPFDRAAEPGIKIPLFDQLSRRPEPGAYEIRGPDNRTMPIVTPVHDVIRFVPEPIRVLRVHDIPTGR